MKRSALDRFLYSGLDKLLWTAIGGLAIALASYFIAVQMIAYWGSKSSTSPAEGRA